MVCGQQLPKREFRGAWLHTVYQDGYARRSTAQNKAWLRGQLDSLRTAGVNAVVFQVRPQADAFYDSRYEPWSCYLTRDGKAPNPYWDPLSLIRWSSWWANAMRAAWNCMRGSILTE